MKLLDFSAASRHSCSIILSRTTKLHWFVPFSCFPAPVEERPVDEAGFQRLRLRWDVLVALAYLLLPRAFCVRCVILRAGSVSNISQRPACRAPYGSTCMASFALRVPSDADRVNELYADFDWRSAKRA